jgi:hypothetical protein
MWEIIILFSLVSILGILMTTNYEFLTKRKPKKYKPDDLTEYRQRISEDLKRKELNRDFNFEVPFTYKTPYQYLDYQDMLINDNDIVYQTRMSDLSKYLQDSSF